MCYYEPVAIMKNKALIFIQFSLYLGTWRDMNTCIHSILNDQKKIVLSIVSNFLSLEFLFLLLCAQYIFLHCEFHLAIFTQL